MKRGCRSAIFYDLYDVRKLLAKLGTIEHNNQIIPTAPPTHIPFHPEINGPFDRISSSLMHINPKPNCKTRSCTNYKNERKPLPVTPTLINNCLGLSHSRRDLKARRTQRTYYHSQEDRVQPSWSAKMRNRVLERGQRQYHTPRIPRHYGIYACISRQIHTGREKN